MKITNLFHLKNKTKKELYFFCLPIVMCLCWFISFLPNLTTKLSFQPFIFFGSSTISSILRVLGALLLGLYFSFFLIYKRELHKSLLIVASLLLFFVAISFYNFKQSVTYNTLDTSYNVVSTEEVSIGLYEILLHYGNTALRFVLLLVLFALFPYFPNKTKSVLILSVFISSIMFLSLVYSLALEFDKYSSTIQNYTKGKYDLDISSFFPSKNSFGLFLFQYILALSYLLFFFTIKKQNIVRLLIIILIILTTVVIFCTKCFTSILSTILFFLVYPFVLMNIKKKRNLLNLFYSIFLLLFLVLFILFLTIPQFHSSGIFQKLFDTISSIFDDTRLYIYSSYFNNLKLGDLLCGYGFRARYFIMYWTTNSGGYISVSDMHNGILQFSVLYGLFFVALYLSLCLLSILYVIKNKTLATHKKFLIISMVIATLFYGMLEDVQLFLTSSANSFLISYMIATCFKGSAYEK